MKLALAAFFLFINGLSAQTNKDLLNEGDFGTLEHRFDAYQKLAHGFMYNNPDSALWSSIQMFTIAQQMKDYTRMGDACRSLSINYSSVGLHDQALIESYKAIDYYDSSGADSKLVKIADIYHNMGWTFTYLEEYDKTLLYFKNALAIRPLKDREDSLAYLKGFHAQATFFFLYQYEYDSSVIYFDKILSWVENLHLPFEEIAQIEVEFAHALLLMKNYDEALNKIEKIRAFPSDSVSDYVIQYTNYLDGIYYNQIGDYSEALIQFDQVYDWLILSENEHSEIGINALRQMVETAEKAGEFKKGYEYLQRLRRIEKESIYKDRQRATKVLEIANETKRKEQLIKIQKDQISLQNQVIWIAIIGTLGISILAFFLFRSRKKVQAKSEKIEILMRELHHRVKNNLQVISSLLGLQSMNLADESAKQAVSEGKQRIKANSSHSFNSRFPA